MIAAVTVATSTARLVLRAFSDVGAPLMNLGLAWQIHEYGSVSG